MSPESKTTTKLGRVHLAQSKAQDALVEMEQEKHRFFQLFGLTLAFQAVARKKESDARLKEMIAKFPKDASFQIAGASAFGGRNTKPSNGWIAPR